jgi:15-cis-phytoene synthase
MGQALSSFSRAEAGDADDALCCERIVRAHARTFTLASLFLPARKRRATYALYAFCRVADDIVDEGVDGAAAASHRLAMLERDLEAALAGRPRTAVLRELARAADAFAVPADVLRELLAGVARDLRPPRYDTWADLSRYCEGVASTVGEMCTHVFGVAGGPDVRERALRYARTLGVAMQLTNILRDVGEDARRGRCYLPADDLAAFGLTPGEVLASADDGGRLARDERWRPMMAFAVGRARALYAAADPGIGLLAADARRCAWACAAGYAGILGAIAAADYDTLRGRVRVSNLGRAAILLSAVRAPGRFADAGPTPAGDGPRVAWDTSGEPRPAGLVRLA